MRRYAEATFSDEELTDMMVVYLDHNLEFGRPPEGDIVQRNEKRAALADAVDELLTSVFGKLGGPQNVNESIIARVGEGLKQIVLTHYVNGLLGPDSTVAPFGNVGKEMIHDRINWADVVYVLAEDRYGGGMDVGGDPVDFTQFETSDDLGIEPGKN